MDVINVDKDKKRKRDAPKFLPVEAPTGSNEIIRTNITTTTPSTTTSVADEDDWEASKSFKRATTNPTTGTYRSSVRHQVNSSDFSEDDHAKPSTGASGLRPGTDDSLLNSASSFRSSMHALIKDNKVIPKDRYSSKFKDQGKR